MRAFHNSVLLLLVLVLGLPAYAISKPKVRAITAFIKLDRTTYKQEITRTIEFLHAAKKQFEVDGYEVQTIRITTQPFPQYTRGLSHAEALAFLLELDRSAKTENVDLNLGPAMMNDADDPAAVQLLAEVLAKSTIAAGTVHIAGADGIHWNAVRAAARLIKYEEENSSHSQGTFNFAAVGMLGPYAPFYPGSYHDGSGKKFSVGLQSANVVIEVFSETGYDPAAAGAKLKTALATEAIATQAIAERIAKSSGWEYMGLDPTPAPLREVSIGQAIERFTGKKFGASGTLTAAFVITDAVRSVPVKQIGYSGLMLPVLEDTVMAERWSEGTYNLDSLLAYSSVCGTGLDTVPLPGDVSEEQLARMIGDVAALAFKWKKPLTARLQPVKGRKAGERSEFDDPFLVNATLQPLP